MAESETGVIRSYQRIFRPERRLYQIEGRRLPVPGGVPLRWLGWAAGTLLVVLALSAGSGAVTMAAAGAAALAGLVAAGRRFALACGLLAVVAVPALGVALRLLDWPLRFVVLPALVATLATQATPDGRRADRFAWSWLSVRLSAQRRSLGRTMPLAGRPHVFGGRLWVAACGGALLRRGRVRGPGQVSFGAPVVLSRGWIRRRRLVARPRVSRSAPGEMLVTSLELGADELLEVRP